MFDNIAIKLIQQAPVFGDINLDTLSKELTSAYTDIVSARMTMREEDSDTDDLVQLLNKIKRIATTYEAYVFLLSNRENSDAAAFVSASAYQLSFQLMDMLEQPEKPALSNSGISPKVSAAILYFTANYMADATEIINAVSMKDCNETESYLLCALKALLSGNLHSVNDLYPRYPDTEQSATTAASNSLWAHLHKGVFLLLKSLTTTKDEFNMACVQADSHFESVIQLSQHDEIIEQENKQQSLTYNGIYFGQYYLANLLLIATRNLKYNSLINIPFPSGVDPVLWRNNLSNIVSKRPYLWPNHLAAIDSGYLDKEISAVVSFPTGGGKSTLSQLKIAASLVRSEPVVYVAPTLALVDQVSKELQAIFPTVTTKVSFEGFDISEFEVETLPDILVMTPESFLVRMSFNPDAYMKIGLFVFDECHLLHSKTKDIIDRRSIDAMLCLLRVIEIAEKTDILLMSAMIENNSELSGWLSDLIGKKVLSLNIDWRPTRQAKGCIVYDSRRTDELYHAIGIAKRTSAGRLTAAEKRNLTAQPYCFFSLNQTWHSNEVRDYKLTEIAQRDVFLSVNDYDRLTANRNEVAAVIAESAIRSGVKTLVFAADIKSCDSIAGKASNAENNEKVRLIGAERKLLQLINTELGGHHSYFDSHSVSLPHHGLLIREERQLHESLFSRDSGVDLIVATSTLAQGINLPAECVVIAGNTRFDVKGNKQEELDAHELLNAAGRAGRAGKNATGVVLVIPGKVVSFDAKESAITQYWHEIKDVFSKQDQCLTIEDPLEALLDRLHLAVDFDAEDIRYFTQRLPVDENGDCRKFIQKTFGAYQARKNDNQIWIQERISGANQAFQQLRNEQSEDELDWHDKLASASGIDANILRKLSTSFEEEEWMLVNPIDYLEWLIQWISESYDRLQAFIRIETLERTFKQPFRRLNKKDQAEFFKDKVTSLTNLWLQGASFAEIELALGTNENTLGRCKNARDFVIRVIPEIAYASGILGHVHQQLVLADGNHDGNTALEYLNQMVRQGFDQPSKLALHIVIDSPTTRVNTHIIYRSMKEFVAGVNESQSFGKLLKQMRKAFNQWPEL